MHIFLLWQFSLSSWFNSCVEWRSFQTIFFSFTVPLGLHKPLSWTPNGSSIERFLPRGLKGRVISITFQTCNLLRRNNFLVPIKIVLENRNNIFIGVFSTTQQHSRFPFVVVRSFSAFKSEFWYEFCFRNSLISLNEVACPLNKLKVAKDGKEKEGPLFPMDSVSNFA